MTATCLRVVVLAAACQILLAPVSSAQGSTSRFEVAVSVRHDGGIPFGERDATLTGSAGNRYRLFSTDTSLDAATGVEAVLGVSLSRVFQVEASASYARTSLRTSLANDSEQVAPAVVSEPMKEFLVGGSLIVRIPRWTIASRGVPFVSVGAAHLRDLHQGNVLAQDGQAYHAGGGLTWPLWARGPKHAFGLRAEANAVGREGGAALDRKVHLAPEIAIGAFTRF